MAVDPPRVAPAPIGDDAPHADHASNAERVPSAAESADSLRRQADEHPGSDPEADARHADGRGAEEPNGLSTTTPDPDDDRRSNGSGSDA